MALSYTQDLSREPSPMELKIAIKLKEKGVSYAIEVMFKHCINPLTGQMLKFDFYCYDDNLLIEYDGRNYHIKDEVKARDRIKDKFARAMNIRLVRLKNRADVVDFFNKYKFASLAKLKAKPVKEVEEVPKSKKRLFAHDGDMFITGSAKGKYKRWK